MRGKGLKDMRKKRGMSQGDLAKATGLSRSIISAIEREVPGVGSKETVQRIEKALSEQQAALSEQQAALSEQQAAASEVESGSVPEDTGVKVRPIFRDKVAHVRTLGDQIVRDPKWGNGCGILVGWVNAPWVYLRPLPLMMALGLPRADDIEPLLDRWEREGVLVPEDGGNAKTASVRFPDGNVVSGVFRVDMDKFQREVGDE